MKSIVVNGTMVSFQVDARGTWVYSFSRGQLQQMARLIAGQPQDTARTLLQRQPGVSRVVIETFGGQGSALLLFLESFTPSGKFHVGAFPARYHWNALQVLVLAHV